MDGKRAAQRLPTTTLPAAYRLHLEPDLAHSRFDGAVEIDVELAEAAMAVLLHALDLEIAAASATQPGRAPVEASVSLDRDLEQATLRFPAPLSAGAATLSLRFSGALNDELVGFYRSTFTDAGGVERAIATTQLCLTDARRAFPCFDEPSFKATFQVTVVVPPGASAFSNASLRAERELPDGRRALEFAATVPMSTYLVALVVGPFERTAPVDVDGVALSVVCTPARAGLATFAQEVGVFALRFFSEYFAIPYPGDKVDLVGIPDFAHGAMENLGCVTFRESLLLVDPASASVTELADVAMVICHELAHMWFGDLVTMAWWDGIWLNEAFATHMQYRCADAFRPGWRLWSRFARDRELGLEADALHTTRPIEFPVHSPSEAQGMLDAITYLKGATVLRMLEEYLGDDGYRDGVRRYLREHAFANTVTTDLWAAFEAATGEPVAAVMSSWVLQGGHPVVTLAEGVLTQAPFWYRPADGPSAIGERWRIPVRSRSLRGGDGTVAQLMDADPVPLAVPGPAVVNAGGLGAYRTAYDDAALEALVADLGRLTEGERATLLGDAWALARAGRRPLDDVLTIARALGPVVEPQAWSIVTDVLTTLDRIVDPADRPRVASAAAALFGPLLETLGWERRADEEDRTGIVRALALRGLGVLARDPAVRAEAAARFDAGATVGDLAAAVVAVVASMARPGDADELLARYRVAADPQAAERAWRGLGQVADRATGLRTLAHCFEWFRAQDAPLVVAELTLNPSCGPAVWEAIAADWTATLDRVPAVLQYRLVVGVRSFVEDPVLAERVAAFHEAHPLELNQREVERAVERMRNGVAFAERVRRTLDLVSL